jgi:hypothetical protein
MRRTILMEASWPSNKEAAVIKRGGVSRTDDLGRFLSIE